MLATVRPELGKLSAQERHNVRHRLLVDSAVMMQGYAYLIRDFNTAMGQKGLTRAEKSWRQKLRRLSSNVHHVFGNDWRGDIFEKRNPLWQQVGVLKPGRDGMTLTVLNTGAARSQCGRVLRQIVETDEDVRDIRFLAAG